MAGHSKWSNIKHRKGIQDAKRGKLFAKLSKEITIAAFSNQNPTMNSTLRMVISKAKAHSMPKKNIENAIKNANRNNKNKEFKEISYAANILGVSFLITCLTNNLNRTYSEIQYIVSKANGIVSNFSSVLYLFDRKGILEFNGKSKNEEKLMMISLEAGAEDFKKEGNSFLVYTLPHLFSIVKEKLESQGILEFKIAEVKYIPLHRVELPKEKAEKILNFIDKIEDNDDVINIYHNFNG